MHTVPFSTMPTLVKVATGLALFEGWVLFENYVVDRWFWNALPFYVKGSACVWDLSAAILISVALTAYAIKGRGRTSDDQ